MKRTYNSQWLFNSKNEFMGIRIGYGGASEHEHGITSMQRYLGVVDSKSNNKCYLWQTASNYLNPLAWYVDGYHLHSEKILGIDSRRIHNIPYVYVHVFNHKYFDCKCDKFALFILNDYFNICTSDMLRYSYKYDISAEFKSYNSIPLPFKNKNLAAAWGSNAIEIVTTVYEQHYLYILEQAIFNKDIIIYVDYKDLRHNLMMLIISKMDEADIQFLYNQDKEIDYIGNSLLDTDIYDMFKNLTYYQCLPYMENGVIYFDFEYSKQKYEYKHHRHITISELKQILGGK